MDGDVVRQVTPPTEASGGSLLTRVDYCDAFLTVAADEDAERWARRVVEGGSWARRTSLVVGWLGLGLTVRPRDRSTVLGWEVREHEPDRVLLGVGSRIGMPAELLLQRHDDAWLFATRVHLGNAGARALWRAVVPTHVHTVRGLLVRAAAGTTLRP